MSPVLSLLFVAQGGISVIIATFDLFFAFIRRGFQPVLLFQVLSGRMFLCSGKRPLLVSLAG